MQSRFKHGERTHMTISVTEEIKHQIEQIAAQNDMSASALCRELFRKEIARKEIARHEICENSRPGNR